MGNSDHRFDVLCQFFDAYARQKTPRLKQKHLSKFREGHIDRTSDDVYEVYRLILPAVSLVTLPCHLGAVLGSACPDVPFLLPSWTGSAVTMA